METSNVAGPTSPVAATGPKIAYDYTVTYDFDHRGVAAVQERQLELCRRLGPTRCVVVKSGLTTPGPGEHFASDEATLLIDERLAPDFNRRLDAIATSGGATVSSRGVSTEDVTRKVIDVDARVRAKQALADRLLALIRGGNGKVGDLVAAERAYAATQEELDAARGEQADLARRVAMADVQITYVMNDAPGRSAPVIGSIAAAGDTLAASVAALVTALIAALPWVAVLVAIVLGVRRWRRRGARRA